MPTNGFISKNRTCETQRSQTFQELRLCLHIVEFSCNRTYRILGLTCSLRDGRFETGRKTNSSLRLRHIAEATALKINYTSTAIILNLYTDLTPLPKFSRLAWCVQVSRNRDGNRNESSLGQFGASWQDSCINDAWWVRNRFCEQRCFEEGQGYGVNCTTEGSYREDHVCGFYQELVPFKTAQQKCEDVGMKICDRTGTGDGCL